MSEKHMTMKVIYAVSVETKNPVTLSRISRIGLCR